MNVAVIGCGLIGQRRARNLANSKLVVCCDTDISKAVRTAADSAAEPVDNWTHAIERDDVDAVVVATPHESLAEISIAAIRAGKDVLVEKPAACSLPEIDTMIDAAEVGRRIVMVGYNLRYRRSFRQAWSLVSNGNLGRLMFIRARYGHGGRLGYAQEWRMAAKHGGGQLFDQGSHLIDLCRWFLGDFSDVHARLAKCYWKAEVEDNAFLSLQTPAKNVAWLHTGSTEWRNIFSFELYGTIGKLEARGLGGSYGVESLIYNDQRTYGPPPTKIWEYPMEDDSWLMQWKEFERDVEYRTTPAWCNLQSARSVLGIIEKAKESNNERLVCDS